MSFGADPRMIASRTTFCDCLSDMALSDRFTILAAPYAFLAFGRRTRMLNSSVDEAINQKSRRGRRRKPHILGTLHFAAGLLQEKYNPSNSEN